MGATGATGSAAEYGIATSTVVDSGGTLRLDGTGAYDNPLLTIPDAQLLAGGTIDITTLSYAATETATLNPATDVLTITGATATLQIQLAGDYTGEFFALTPDAAGGTDIITDGTPCYCRGTHILTAQGEIPVEDLRIGDRLITSSRPASPGILRPLRWIGRRSYAAAAAANNPDALPVRFRAGCLGNGLPQRDLYVSPLHALYLDGVLVPAECLVNATTITRCTTADRVEYFHLELDSHDIILAEGVPAETYVDDANRSMFHNAADHAARYPHAPSRPAHYCAPRIDDGTPLQAIRRRLAGLHDATSAPLRGYLEHVGRGRIAGWAQSGRSGAVRLRLAANGITLAAFAADRPRADVVAELGGDLHCGFDHIIDGGLPDPTQTITVIRVPDGAILARL